MVRFYVDAANAYIYFEYPDPTLTLSLAPFGALDLASMPACATSICIVNGMVIRIALLL